MIGRRIEVTADLERVRAFCDGRVVADHERIWARHQTLTDPAHWAAAQTLRRQRLTVIRPADEPTCRSAAWPTTTPRLAWTGGISLMSPAKTTSARDLAAEVAYLTRALKAPTLREAVPRLAERARAENWSHEEFLVACLQREVSARESHGGEGRIRAARFPARKSLEEFDFDHARRLNGTPSPTWAPWTS